MCPNKDEEEISASSFETPFISSDDSEIGLQTIASIKSNITV
jgi:hypothetical protein